MIAKFYIAAHTEDLDETKQSISFKSTINYPIANSDNIIELYQRICKIVALNKLDIADYVYFEYYYEYNKIIVTNKFNYDEIRKYLLLV